MDWGSAKAIVNFNSDGGVLLDGIAIGKTIRLKSFSTAVLDGKRCASACALAWLGGSPRYMGRTALVGFHAAYIKKEGLPSSGVGNALVGSYLTQIGLSETAVVYITQAAPTELTLLTLRDAEKIGIEVSPFEQADTYRENCAACHISRNIHPRNDQSSSVVRQGNVFTKLTHQCRWVAWSAIRRRSHLRRQTDFSS
jgi:hypothetical protein